MSKENEGKLEEFVRRSQQEQIEKEKKELNDRKRVNSDSLDSSLSSMIKNKNIASQFEFLESGKKEAGKSLGYIAKEEDTNNTFMIKAFIKSDENCLSSEDYINRRDGVNEFITGSLYELLLNNRVPKIALVLPNKNNNFLLYLRSKFLNNVTELSIFSGTTGTHINPKNPKLRLLTGFEKAAAACHILGDGDYHAGNLLVQTDHNEEGQEIYVVTKIDHGRSLMVFHKDFDAFITTIYNSFTSKKYLDAIEVGNLSFDVEKYLIALKQMLKQIDNEKISLILNKKISELQKAGFDFKNLDANFRFESKFIVSEPTKSNKSKIERSQFQSQKIIVKDLGYLVNVYEQLLITSLKSIEQITKDIEVISKFSNVKPEFKKGGWIKEFYNSTYRDPIIFAANNDILIEGMNPLEWALNNKRKVISIEIKQQEKDITRKIKVKNSKSWKEENIKSKELILERKEDDIKYDPMTLILVHKKNNIPLSYEEIRFLKNHLKEYSHLLKKYEINLEQIEKTTKRSTKLISKSKVNNFAEVTEKNKVEGQRITVNSNSSVKTSTKEINKRQKIDTEKQTAKPKIKDIKVLLEDKITIKKGPFVAKSAVIQEAIRGIQVLTQKHLKDNKLDFFEKRAFKNYLTTCAEAIGIKYKELKELHNNYVKEIKTEGLVQQSNNSKTR
ncbi:MAG: hypothetical protein J0H68_03925 [Sphingobacteriia bacterium]|nr:hypothetical protein [Sphingobacteriia bacterium]